jgi:hypothetical protein
MCKSVPVRITLRPEQRNDRQQPMIKLPYHAEPSHPYLRTFPTSPASLDTLPQIRTVVRQLGKSLSPTPGPPSPTDRAPGPLTERRKPYRQLASTSGRQKPPYLWGSETQILELSGNIHSANQWRDSASRLGLLITPDVLSRRFWHSLHCSTSVISEFGWVS